MAWPCGFLLVDKPRGVTSRDVVEDVHRRLGPPRRRSRGKPRFRCGHAGTLDPLATGLLLVLVGGATRLSQFLLGHDKTYTTTFRFGEATDSLDADGRVTETRPALFDGADLDAALVDLHGNVSQVPPLISALKRNGLPLYERVRAGEDLEPPPARVIRIDEFRRLGSLSDPDEQGRRDGRFVIQCSSGTYVRSCGRDLAAALGAVAHVIELRRERVGLFQVEDALSLDSQADSECLLAALRPPSDAMPEIPSLLLSADEASGLRQGHQPAADWAERLQAPPRGVAIGRESLWKALDDQGDLVAVGRTCEDADETERIVLKTATVFAASGES